ncbi:hypothetical protein N0V82_004224 [Gnomoniopsis sp. IMI 355080]|nr:hypothetical protein N0V82_004224 [Gnomoniopsis sp. IMI 355080]
MSSYNSSIGLAPARLLPVTGAFALPFTAYFLYLSGRCVQYRLRDEHWIGDDSSKKDSDSPSGKSVVATQGDKYNDLLVSTRAHANFAENVPLAFILAALAELNGANRKVLTGAMTILFALRVLHADFGLIRPGSMAVGRPVGYFGTAGVLGALAGYSAWLAKDFWGL